jgi:hypothetical protein
MTDPNKKGSSYQYGYFENHTLRRFFYNQNWKDKNFQENINKDEERLKMKTFEIYKKIEQNEINPEELELIT